MRNPTLVIPLLSDKGPRFWRLATHSSSCCRGGPRSKPEAAAAEEAGRLASARGGPEAVRSNPSPAARLANRALSRLAQDPMFKPPPLFQDHDETASGGERRRRTARRANKSGPPLHLDHRMTLERAARAFRNGGTLLCANPHFAGLHRRHLRQALRLWEQTGRPVISVRKARPSPVQFVGHHWRNGLLRKISKGFTNGWTRDSEGFTIHGKRYPFCRQYYPVIYQAVPAVFAGSWQQWLDCDRLLRTGEFTPLLLAPPAELDISREQELHIHLSRQRLYATAPGEPPNPRTSDHPVAGVGPDEGSPSFRATLGTAVRRPRTRDSRLPCGGGAKSQPE